jgi:hypothetical protein
MAILNSAMRDVLERRVSEDTLFELAQLFREAGRWDEFDKAVGERYPDRIVDELRDRFGIRRRFRR